MTKEPGELTYSMTGGQRELTHPIIRGLELQTSNNQLHAKWCILS